MRTYKRVEYKKSVFVKIPLTTCDVCGKQFESKGDWNRKCSDVCRKIYLNDTKIKNRKYNTSYVANMRAGKKLEVK
jgi:predicted nucleic acid-binding Zn ribbon protein